MNSVTLMVALMAVPDTASFGNRGGCGDPCGRPGLFSRCKAFFAKCNLFNRCRSKHACWAPPSSCCGGGFEVGGFDGMAMGGMPMGGMPMGGMPMGGMAMGGMPMGDGMMMGDGMAMGGMPMGGMPMGGQPGGYCPGCNGQSQPQMGMPYGGMAMAQPYAQGGYAPGAVQNGVQPTYGAVSAYPMQMPSGQAGFTAHPSQTWLANPQQPTAPVLNNPTPVNQAPVHQTPAIPVPTPIPSNSGASLPQGAFPGMAPAAAVIPAYATGGEDYAPAKLRFQVPTGAVVFVDGQKVEGSGPVRKFHTPTLPRGRTFFYEFRAEVEVNGVKVVEEKVLPVCAGDDLNETFAKLVSAGVSSAK